MFAKRRRKYYTIPEIHSFVSSLELKAKRLPEIIGFRSSDTCKNFKDLITLCNSLSIVFIQYDLIQDCMIILKAATETDANLCKHGTVLDRLWQNRILTFNNLAFLYHRVNQPGDSLKFLYEAHGLAQNIKESGGVTNCELLISSNILTFIALWKLKRYNQASVYVELSGDLLHSILTGSKQTHFTENSTQNIFGLLSVFMAGLAVKLESSLKKGIIILEDCLEKVQSADLQVRSIIKNLIKELYRRRNANSSALYTSNSEVSIEHLQSEDYLPKIPSEVLKAEVKTAYDWLVTIELESLFFMTCFVPFISPSTPLIKVSELEGARSRFTGSSNQSGVIKEPIGDSELPSINSKNQKINSRQSYLRKMSNDRSPPRSQAWWEKKPETRYQSEPRGSSYSNKVNLPRMETSNKASQGKNSGMGKHIMIEFNPMQGSNMPIELVPVHPSKGKMKTGVLDPFYQDICD